MDRSSLWGVVLAAGQGSRLQELTRALTGQPIPKQFCHFGSERSLLQETLVRLRALIPPQRQVVIVAEQHSDLAIPQLADYGELTLVRQPLDRGTALGVLLPLLFVLEQDEEATIVLTPSDHGIGDDGEFELGLIEAARAVEKAPERLIIFGVEASRPATDYGWIQPSTSCDVRRRIVPVKRFVEKPPLLHARRLHALGALWNTMILVTKAKTLLARFRELYPQITETLSRVRRVPRLERPRWILETYRSLSPVDFSRDIMGRARDLEVYAWPSEMGWNDLGTSDRMLEWMQGQGASAEILGQLAALTMASSSPGMTAETS